MNGPDMLYQALNELSPPLQNGVAVLEWKHGSLKSGAVDIVKLQLQNKHLKFNTISKTKIEHSQIPFVEEQAKQLQQNSPLPTLVISKIIYPEIGKRLQAAHINFIDTYGNIYINTPTVFIYNTGQKPKRSIRENKNRLFQEAGVRLLFGLLQHPQFVRLSYREMAEATGVSLGSVNIIIKELIKAEYLVELSKRTKKLIRQKELLQRWVTAYQEVLKPRITIGNYKFGDNKLFRQYKTIDVSKWDALWGGEPAADIYTNYLSPGKLTLFLPDDSGTWRRDLVLMQAESAPEIEVLKYFWDIQHPLFRTNSKFNNVVPPLLVYADLITSTDSRNIETAKRIFDDYLQFEQ